MDAHLRWDWDILVLRRLGRWSQLRKRKCVLEVCFNIIKFDISNVQSTSLMKISVRLSGHHVAYKCKCVRLVIYVSLRWRSLQGSAALLFAVIYLTETSLAPSQLSPKASFPCLSPSARLSVCHKATFIYIYKNYSATYYISFHWQYLCTHAVRPDPLTSPYESNEKCRCRLNVGRFPACTHTNTHIPKAGRGKALKGVKESKVWFSTISMCPSWENRNPIARVAPRMISCILWPLYVGVSTNFLMELIKCAYCLKTQIFSQWGPMAATMERALMLVLF